MQFEGYSGKINAHNRSQISTIILSKHHPGMLVSIAQDGLVNLISPDLKIHRSVCLNTEYLTSLINYKDGYLIGTDGGFLYKLDKEFEIQNKYRIDIDCISGIVETQKYVITVSFDGNVIFLDKKSFIKLKQLKFDVVFQKVVQINDRLYVSGNPSFQINLQTFEFKELQRTDQIFYFQNHIYQYSDENGFGSLSANQQNCIPCQFAMVVQNSIMVVYEQEVGFIITNEDEEEVQYKFYKIENLPSADIVKTGVYYNGTIYLGYENGTIYQLKLKINKN